MAPVKQFFQALLDVFLPPICHICREFIPHADEIHICPDCRRQLPLVISPLCPVCGIPFIGTGDDHRCGQCLTQPPRFDTARAAFLYEGAMRDLIHSFKYDRRSHLRRPLTLLVLEELCAFLQDAEPQIIVPVPLHRSRLRQRGFNQAVLLGTLLARRLSLPMLPDALVRTRRTEPQIELSAAERRSNVKGAFSVKRSGDIAGKRVLLLDDVMTTGSTMNECAGELKKSGVNRVIAVTIARTAR
jgi:ComF family protein